MATDPSRGLSHLPLGCSCEQKLFEGRRSHPVPRESWVTARAGLWGGGSAAVNPKPHVLVPAFIAGGGSRGPSPAPRLVPGVEIQVFAESEFTPC